MATTVRRRTADVYRNVAASSLDLQAVVLIALATLALGILVGLALAGLLDGSAGDLLSSLSGVGPGSVTQGGR